jgi:hypothetical protein
MSEIVDRIVELGFNCVRMMYSTQGREPPWLASHTAPVRDAK